MVTNKEVELMPSENIPKAFDADKAEAFSTKLLMALNYGSLSLMMSTLTPHDPPQMAT